MGNFGCDVPGTEVGSVNVPHSVLPYSQASYNNKSLPAWVYFADKLDCAGSEKRHRSCRSWHPSGFFLYNERCVESVLKPNSGILEMIKFGNGLCVGTTNAIHSFGRRFKIQIHPFEMLVLN